MNTFKGLMIILSELSESSFYVASESLTKWINDLTFTEYFSLIQEIGVIPESVQHDSTEEKLFAKATDIVLARGFREIGLKAEVLHSRSDSADVQAESKYHNYSLVADSKAFRLSRTARNQKDYKIVALSGWRKDAEFAVLCAPFFQYPNSRSQIYEQAINNNVLIFSWEQLLIMLKYGIKETEKFNLLKLWNWSDYKASQTIIADAKNCFLKEELAAFADYLHLSEEQILSVLNEQINQIKKRGTKEIDFWKNVISKIHSYSREKAIEELLKEKKIETKISTIQEYTRKLNL